MNDAAVSVSQLPRRDLVIVVVDKHPKSTLLLYAARKRAREIGGRWRVLYIERAEGQNHDIENAEERLLRLFTLAEQMGGEVQQLRTETFERGLRTVFETEKARLAWVVAGDHRVQPGFRHWWTPYALRGKAFALAKQYANVEVLPLGGTPIHRQWGWPNLRQENPHHFLYAALAVAGAYLISSALEALLPPALFRINIQNISLLFMTACAFTAGRYGLLPGLVAATLSAVTYNYYYVPPYHELHLLNVTKGLSMALFFAAASLIAIFAGQARLYGQRSARRERSTQVLLMLYHVASHAFSRQQALETLRRKLYDMLQLEVAFFMPPVMQPEVIEPVVPANLTLDERDQRALEVCWTEAKTTGLAAPSYSTATWRFKPMVTSSGVIGVFAVRPREGEGLETWMRSLLAGIADQIAIIVEHFELTHSMQTTRIREERDKLRTMLLSSVSHDLKTPLSGIIGSLSVYHSVGNRLSPERRSELLKDALEEAQRLDRFITNILDITKLESGKIEFHPEWHEMNGIIRTVVKRMQYRLQTRRIVITPYPEMIEVYMDAMMTEQILQNLLDNACKYTPDGTRIHINNYVREGVGLCCEVHDHGAGIPEDKLNTVFDKYARLQKLDSQVAGTGLGLSICKAVMEAQGGWITAANHPEGGAVFTFCYPKWRTMAPGEAIEDVA